ncbi:WD40-repeat-containing domain protein [Cercophora newfieldiana]|uniref:WD40-repeat-containing domain protein n=1 Tax=Cercophora newfieldiana TaxID=92897 RepID=A0AA40CZM0_9PEZI|nr:WD40-repeat-containing domain protein [Cercophora newfieldiana]
MTQVSEGEGTGSGEEDLHVGGAPDETSESSDEDVGPCYHCHDHHQLEQHYPDHTSYHHISHGLPHQAQLAYFDDLDGYISDDLDMSVDSGVPLVNYLEVAQLLTSDMDLDPSMGSSGEFDFDSTEPENATQITETSSPNVDDVHLPISPTAGLANMLSHLQPALHPLNPSAVSTQLEQLMPDTDDPATAAWFEGTHPVALTNPNPNALGPGNYSLSDFLHHWARQSRGLGGMPRERGRYPWPGRINDISSRPLTHVQYADLNGDQCDLQGVDWDHIGVTRREARERRLLTYNNYVNHQGSDRWTPNLPDVALPRTESFFRFRRMDIRHDVNLSHFQLRNVLAAGSRTRVFYPGTEAVHQFNPISGEGEAVMKLGETPGSQISTLAAEHDVLIAGCFNGEYILRHLNSDEPESIGCHDGVITTNISGITNHAQIHQARGGTTPLAAFASNDMYFRVLDIATETWLSREKFAFPLNCTAVSPDRRLRVMVGDDLNVLVTAAESTLSGGRPEVLQSLSGHRDFGFACDWADDGWTVATGFQDKSIKIWDARRWTDSSGVPTPVCTLRAEMAGVRSLRFSPIGSGKRILAAAEEADFINIIDAQTFRSKQTVDIFGEIGGISFMNDGQDLEVLCCDHTRGGLLQLERCGEWQEVAWKREEERAYGRNSRWRQEGSFDWQPSQFTEQRRVKESDTRRRRKRAMVDGLDPF